MRHLYSTNARSFSVLSPVDRSFRYNLKSYNQIKIGDVISDAKHFYRVFDKTQRELVYECNNVNKSKVIEKHFDAEKLRPDMEWMFKKPTSSCGFSRRLNRKETKRFDDAKLNFGRPPLLIMDKNNKVRYFHDYSYGEGDIIWNPQDGNHYELLDFDHDISYFNIIRTTPYPNFKRSTKNKLPVGKWTSYINKKFVVVHPDENLFN